MNLTEGQLFTIEALNRIDGFEWPEGMSCAGMMEGGCSVWFFQGAVATMPDFLSFAGWVTSSRVSVEHPDWRNSLITREQFDSVDGWVRDSGYQKAMNIEKVQQSIGGYKWRYHKPTKETDVQSEATKQPSIDEIYSQYKTQRGIVESAKKSLADEMEAEDKLLEQIKAWNLEHGFDVRLLDESEENPELVITDWRDLRVGDEVKAIRVESVANIEGSAGIVMRIDIGAVDGPLLVDFGNGNEWWVKEWKFIRRPTK